MREILFRGKTKNVNEFIEGYLAYLFHHPDMPSIMPYCYYANRYHAENEKFSLGYSLGEFIPVIHDTVGQFTGLLDKNGKKVFEGDIVKINGTTHTVFYDFAGFAIESNPKCFGYGSQSGSNPTDVISDNQGAGWFSSHAEIIGNIHDNKDLLK